MNERKRVLIITYYWPPSGGSGVQRWLKFVKYLSDFDWEPVVVIPDGATYPIIDSELKEDIPAETEVIPIKIWEVYRALNFFSKKSSQRNYTSIDKGPKGLKSRIMLNVRANFFVPDARCVWIKPVTQKLSKLLADDKLNIDAIVTTGPPHSVHLIGLNLKRKFKDIPWIADFRDPWTGITYFEYLPLWPASRRRHYALERQVLDSADKIIVIGNTMKTEYEAPGRYIQVIRNGHDFSRTEDNPVKLDEKFSISHIGMMNNERNPHGLWIALRDALYENDDLKEYLEIVLIGETGEEVIISLKKYGLIQYVRFIPYLPHSKIRKYQLASQLLLLSVNKVPNNKSILTGKIFEYLSSGRPILAIGPLGGDLDYLLQESKGGILFDYEDITSIREYLKFQFKSFLTKEGIPNVEVDSQRYSRKEMTKKLITALNELVQ